MIPEVITQTLNKANVNNADLQVLSAFFRRHYDGAEGGEWASAICQVANIIKENQSVAESISFLEDSYNAFHNSYARLFSHRALILKQISLAYISVNDYAKSMCYIKRHVQCLLADVAKQDREYDQTYFSFRAFSQYSLKEIKEEKISVAHPRNFNDPLDTLLCLWLDNKIKNIPSENSNLDEFFIMMRKVTEHLKMRCLISSCEDGVCRTINDMSVLMWSHYAKNHTGFCVEYSLPQSLFQPIEQEDCRLLMIKNIEYKTVNLPNEPRIAQLLFMKSEDWSYEKEVRLVLYDPECKEDFPEINCQGLIKAVYLGVKCSDKNKHEMEKALFDKCIPLYQMQVDSENIGKFKHIRIG